MSTASFCCAHPHLFPHPDALKAPAKSLFVLYQTQTGGSPSLAVQVRVGESVRQLKNYLNIIISKNFDLASKCSSSKPYQDFGALNIDAATGRSKFWVWSLKALCRKHQLPPACPASPWYEDHSIGPTTGMGLPSSRAEVCRAPGECWQSRAWD